MKQSKAAARNSERRNVLLALAYNIIENEGFYSINIHHLSDATDIAVPTIYRLFSCKEEILAAIAINGLTKLKAMLLLASEYKGNTRERIVAVHLTQNSFAAQYGVDYQAYYTMKSDGVAQKISQASHLEADRLIADCLNIIEGIILEAIIAQDLVLPEELTPHEFAYHIWALHFGHNVLTRFNYNSEITIRGKVISQRLFFRKMLDNFKWKPYSTEFDYVVAGRRIVRKLKLFH